MFFVIVDLVCSLVFCCCCFMCDAVVFMIIAVPKKITTPSQAFLQPKIRHQGVGETWEPCSACCHSSAAWGEYLLSSVLPFFLQASAVICVASIFSSNLFRCKRGSSASTYSFAVCFLSSS